MKVRRVCIEHDRLARERVIEHAGEARVPAFGHSADVVYDVRFLIVVVDVEVLGTESLEIEVLVLDFVAPEVLGVECGGCDDEKERNSKETAPITHW